MISIGGRPVLEQGICLLRGLGFMDLILTMSHMADQMMNCFGNGERLGVRLEYVLERQPLGTAGALFEQRDRLGNGPFLLMNVDSIFGINYSRLTAFHREQKSLSCCLSTRSPGGQQPPDRQPIRLC